MDSGVLIGGLGFFFGAAITGCVTWYTLRKQSKHDAKMRDLQHEHNFKMSALQYRREGFNKLTELFPPLKMLIVKDLSMLPSDPDWRANLKVIYEKITINLDKLHAITFSYFTEYEDEVYIVIKRIRDDTSSAMRLLSTDMSIEENVNLYDKHFDSLFTESLGQLQALLLEIGKACK